MKFACSCKTYNPDEKFMKEITFSVISVLSTQTCPKNITLKSCEFVSYLKKNCFTMDYLIERNSNDILSDKISMDTTTIYKIMEERRKICKQCIEMAKQNAL